MKRTFLILFLFALNLSLLMASNEPKKEDASKAKCTLSGTISDKITGEPLAGVEVKLLDSEQKYYTDLDGKFEIKEVASGAHSLMINYISYQECIESIQLEKGNTKQVSIELKSVEK